MGERRAQQTHPADRTWGGGRHRRARCRRRGECLLARHHAHPRGACRPAEHGDPNPLRSAGICRSRRGAAAHDDPWHGRRLRPGAVVRAPACRYGLPGDRAVALRLSAVGLPGRSVIGKPGRRVCRPARPSGHRKDRCGWRVSRRAAGNGLRHPPSRSYRRPDPDRAAPMRRAVHRRVPGAPRRPGSRRACSVPISCSGRR